MFDISNVSFGSATLAKTEITLTFKYEAVRLMCIEYGFYTCGNSNDYNNMLAKTEGKVTIETAVEIATDIYTHSNTKLSFRNTLSLLLNECTMFTVD